MKVFMKNSLRNQEALEQSCRGLDQRLWTLPFFTFIALNVFIFMGFDVLLPTLSLYLEGQGNTEQEIGRIYASFTVAAVFMRMVTGRLTMYMNHTNLVRLGLLGCTLAGIGYYFSHTAPTAMLTRFVHGAGFGVASTLITAMASQIIPPARMGEGMGYLGLGTTLALALGPFFGVWLMDSFGFLVLFLVAGAFYALSVGGSYLLPPVKLAVPPKDGPRPPLVMVSRRVIAPSVMVFMIGLALTSTIIYLALYCKEIGLPYAGHFFVISTSGILVSRLTAGRIHDRIGPGYVIIPASIVLIITMLLLAIADSRAMIFTSAVLYGLSTGALFPSIQALAISAVHINQRTEATASFFNAFDIGIGVGSVCLGYVAEKLGSYNSVYWVAVLISVLVPLYFIAAYILFPRKGKAA